MVPTKEFIVPASPSDTRRTELQQWLSEYLSTQLTVPAGEIDPSLPMTAYGLDSITAVALIADVESHLGIELDPDVLWEYPTLASFTSLLAGLPSAAR